MNTYEVIWTIDIEANSPEDAARIAREIQADKNSEALAFDVVKKDGDSILIELPMPEVEDFHAMSKDGYLFTIEAGVPFNPDELERKGCLVSRDIEELYQKAADIVHGAENSDTEEVVGAEHKFFADNGIVHYQTNFGYTKKFYDDSEGKTIEEYIATYVV